MTKSRPLRALCASIAVLVLFTSACGGGESTTSANGSSSPPGADLSCDLLSPEFVGDLIGEVVAVEDGQRDGAYRRAKSACEWSSSLGLDSASDFYYVDVVLHPLTYLDGQITTFGGRDLDGPAARTVLIGEGTSVQSLYVVDGDDLIGVNLRSSSGSTAPTGSASAVASMQAVATEILSNR